LARRILLLCLLAAAAARPGHAQDRGEKAARAHFQRAEKAFNLGKFDEALTAYEAAYEAKALPGFLFNMAQCHRNLGNAERAVFFYERFLALDPETKNRTLVEELIAEQRKKLDGAKAKPEAAPPPSPVRDAEPAAPLLGLGAAGPAPEPPRRSSAFVEKSAPPSREPAPIYARWWFWAGAAAVVGGGIAAALLINREPAAPKSTLDPIDLRP
jgi:tetratricopeptide (TPR) repeat protein